MREHTHTHTKVRHRKLSIWLYFSDWSLHFPSHLTSLDISAYDIFHVECREIQGVQVCYGPCLINVQMWTCNFLNHGWVGAIEDFSASILKILSQSFHIYCIEILSLMPALSNTSMFIYAIINILLRLDNFLCCGKYIIHYENLHIYWWQWYYDLMYDEW